MEKKYGVTRRSFIGKATAMGAGLAMPSGIVRASADRSAALRDICLATIDVKEFRTVETTEARMRTVLERLEEVAGMKPDIVCLPELFSTVGVKEKRTVRELAEEEGIPGPVSSKIAAFARTNNCYVTCPVYTKTKGHYYNSVILIDRKGSIAGVYHKIHPTKEEITGMGGSGEARITPGTFGQAVVETDFGRVGVQLGYDVHWTDSWEDLKKQHVDIILYPSVFSARRMLRYFAWSNNCYIVSSTPELSQIFDVSGNVVDSSSFFVRYAWARVNIEKVNTDTWPTNYRISAIYRKYGDKVSIKVWGNTEVITIESRDPELNVEDILKEFDLETVDEGVERSRIVQEQYRP
ncbi:MAG TPA: carbon-nitrogen hydrolase family protein [Cyclobacteriaceae bacterium]|nr:carbon-nitrogen hydrolase family protein [Cyclobacteriaceae bacterium]